MTDKKSCLILIYYNRDTGIYTENGGVIKTGKLRALLKGEKSLIKVVAEFVGHPRKFFRDIFLIELKFIITSPK
jgi:hypothetical protein